MKKIMLTVVLLFLILLPIAFLFYKSTEITNLSPIPLKKSQRTIENVVEHYGEAAIARLLPYFKKARVDFPPKALMLLALKEEKTLELWAKHQNDYVFIRHYSIAKLSGTLGPKLREGDKQVPEGAYKITWLHPNSAYHLSMKLNYPNEFDWLHAKEEGRAEPGSNIFIHGKEVSIGCLAMGDTVIEELFVLAAKVGIENINVLIAPSDPREKHLFYDKNSQAAWVQDLYQMLNDEFSRFKRSI